MPLQYIPTFYHWCFKCHVIEESKNRKEPSNTLPDLSTENSTNLPYRNRVVSMPFMYAMVLNRLFNTHVKSNAADKISTMLSRHN
uniref:SFRICE_025482 n=1 Tax=Spodoptera frugiperda TaxID=7108 RepID=A0A2H1WB80_SPOFR